MSFIKDFIKRGYFYQCSNIQELTNITQSKKIAAYIGFDCTASSLHVGNLMQIMILRLLQQHGHKPIVIVGSTTTKIGDPSGKDALRKLISQEQLDQNIAGIKKSLSKFVQFGNGQSDAVMLNNGDWLTSLNYIDFLRDYGKLFSVNRMLSMDSVKLRLDRQQSLTFLEFNYMLLQAYDFYHLNKEYECILQFGGSDQWGNILMGVDLIKKLTEKEAYAITTPLLTTASGTKMGKSVHGAIWLDEDLLSPYDYYQYWRNTEDADLVRFAKLYTEFTDTQMSNFEKLATDDINAAKKQFAFTLTSLCHGEEHAKKALETATKLFEHGQVDDNMETISLDYHVLSDTIPAYDFFFLAKLANSKSDARRLIRGGGAKINDQIIYDENLIINTNYIIQEKSIIKLSAGKKRHIAIKLV